MNFSYQELDYILRGLFALQKLQPSEKEDVQVLINKIAIIKFDIEYAIKS